MDTKHLRAYPFVAIAVFYLCFHFLFGCQAMRNAGLDGQTFASYAQHFSTGAKWVLAVTDGVVPVLCNTGTLDSKICLAYSFAASSLKMALGRVDAALASYQASGTAMSQVELRDAVAEATAQYKRVDAAYKADWQEVTK